ncbi:MAG: LysM peptidoglycan-binding domain-containing protein [Acidobacteria bacterium]|nr:LysM peptidoglycan-binding domain-containing protein [Acidobacteriota bacterium]
MQGLTRFGTPLCVLLVAALATFGPSTPGAAAQQAAASEDQLLPLNDFSPALLGMYRKVLEIDSEIKRFTDRYGLDLNLARSVVLHESGGNGSVVSVDGARGYFQVMPATFRELNVESNIEGGIKYLAQQVRQFGREDYALAAYNGGPGRVSRERPMYLETLQYVIQVSDYRNVLRLYEASIRHHALGIRLETVGEGDSWWSLSQRLGLSILQLRLHNPFLATRALQVGQQVAYPSAPRTDLFTADGDDLLYRTRHGDNYLRLAFVMEVDLETLREANGLWRLQSLPTGQVLRVPLAWEGKYNEHVVQEGDDLQQIAEALESNPWRIVRDNGLWDQQLTPGSTLRVRPEAPRPTFLTYRVSQGDTLGRIASNHGTSVGAIQSANGLGRNTVIRVGQSLRVPAAAN